MHELAITQDIVRIVVEHAEREEARRVTHVHLVVGALSSVVPESVEFYFEHLSRETVAAGATLHFETVPARARCRACAGTFEPREFDWACPHCGGFGADLEAGEELAVSTIDVEET